MRPRMLLVLAALCGACAAHQAQRPAAQQPAAPLGMLEGVVRDARGPVAGAIVAANRYGQEVPAPIISRSDGAGRFHFELPPATYALTATSPGKTAAYLPDVEVSSGGHLTTTLPLEGEAVLLVGQLRTRSGQPPAQATIQAVRISNVDGDVFIFDAPADGSFELTLPRAAYMLTATAGALASATDLATPEKASTLLLVKQASGAAPTPEALATLRRHTVPLRSVTAGSGFEDIKALDPLFEGARVIALGEATHGTREFFQLKHRLLEYLVATHGFRIFAIEATQPEAFEINDYILTGKGDPRKALAGLYFWTWDTEEVLALIAWMRSWNAAHPKEAKLKFYGIDMQHPVRAAQLVTAYLKASAPTLLQRHAATLEALADPLRDQPSRAQWLSIQSALAQLAAQLDAHPGSLDDARARQGLRVLEQGAAMNLEQDTVDTRDRAMAANALWALEQEGAQSKMVLWAHNEHVRLEGSTLGAALKQALGGAVKSFGFGFGEGRFQAIDQGKAAGGLREFNAPAAPPETFDGACLALGQPWFVIDLDRLYADPEVGAFEGMLSLRNTFGSAASDATLATFVPTVLEGAYDGWIFVAKTTAARALPSGRREERVVGPPANLAFEAGFERWAARGPEALDYSIALSATERAPVKPATDPADKPSSSGQAVTIRRPPGSRYGPGHFAQLVQEIAGAGYVGKRLRLQAFVKLSGTMRASIELIDRTAAPSGELPGLAAGSTFADWKSVGVELDVPKGVDVLTLRLRATGEGAAWFDGLTLTEVAPP